MTKYLSAEDLTTGSELPTEEVEVIRIVDGKPVPGLVLVRALNRTEAMGLRTVTSGKNALERVERKMLSIAMLEPKLTEAQVTQWGKRSAAGTISVVADVVSRLSGMTVTAAKEAYEEFEENPDEEFPVQSG